MYTRPRKTVPASDLHAIILDGYVQVWPDKLQLNLSRYVCVFLSACTILNLVLSVWDDYPMEPSTHHVH